MNLGAQVLSTAALIKTAQQRDNNMSNSIVLDLTKKFELNLTKAGIINIPILQTRAAVDKSGSMNSLFKNGFVDKTVNLVTVAALKFDDNQSLELGFFDEEFEQAEEAQEADIGQYMKTKGRKIQAIGGTAFAPIIEAMESKLADGATARVAAPKAPEKKGWFRTLVENVTGTSTSGITNIVSGKRVEPDRGYVVIITDGQNGDKTKFEKLLSQTSGDTFFQFVGIGNDVDDKYLNGLATNYKHVAFFEIPNPNALDDNKFYELICNPKFTTWCNINA